VKRCWQIRQMLAKDQAGVPDGWLLECSKCPVFESDRSCWEQCDRCPCCAPVYVTCDFCPLYIEHRMEIKSLSQTDAAAQIDIITQTGKAAGKVELQSAAYNHPQGKRGAPVMEKLQLSIPGMWADHHVLEVRHALSGLPGIESVYASSAWKQALVTFDSSQIDCEKIEAALAQAGYPTGDEAAPAGDAATKIVAGLKGRDPRWEVLGARTTRTNRADLDMSGEFRRY
jgi:copper chaperone CopZ